MTSKERVNAVLEGKPVDRCPITVPYVNLYHRDHFSELTGKPQWHVHKWLNAEPDEYVRLLKQLVNKVSFEIIEPSPNVSTYGFLCFSMLELTQPRIFPEVPFGTMELSTRNSIIRSSNRPFSLNGGAGLKPINSL